MRVIVFLASLLCCVNAFAQQSVIFPWAIAPQDAYELSLLHPQLQEASLKRAEGSGSCAVTYVADPVFGASAKVALENSGAKGISFGAQGLFSATRSLLGAQMGLSLAPWLRLGLEAKYATEDLGVFRSQHSLIGGTNLVFSAGENFFVVTSLKAMTLPEQPMDASYLLPVFVGAGAYWKSSRTAPLQLSFFGDYEYISYGASMISAGARAKTLFGLGFNLSARASFDAPLPTGIGLGLDYGFDHASIAIGTFVPVQRTEQQINGSHYSLFPQTVAITLVLRK